MKHIADGESAFVVVSISPDFCDVDGTIVPFDIAQKLSATKHDVGKHFFSRGEQVLRVGTTVDGVEGDAGEGVFSGVSQGDGHTIVVQGSDRLSVGGFPVAHDGHRVLMNIKKG